MNIPADTVCSASLNDILCPVGMIASSTHEILRPNPSWKTGQHWNGQYWMINTRRPNHEKCKLPLMIINYWRVGGEICKPTGSVISNRQLSTLTSSLFAHVLLRRSSTTRIDSFHTSLLLGCGMKATWTVGTLTTNFFQVTSEKAGAEILRCFFQLSPSATRTLQPYAAKTSYISRGLGNRERETDTSCIRSVLCPGHSTKYNLYSCGIRQTECNTDRPCRYL